MCEFRVDKKEFIRKTIRRVFFEFSVLSILFSIFYLEILSFSNWLELMILGSMSLYIIVGIILFPSTKSFIESSSLKVNQNQLTFSNKKYVNKIDFSDLSKLKMKKKNGRICKIKIETNYGLKLNLSNYENRQLLYEKLKEYS